MLSFTINYLSVLIAAIVSFVLGFLWYGPLFGKEWIKLMRINPKDVKRKGPKSSLSMILGFITSIIIAWFLAIFISAVGAEGILESIVVSMWAWLGFVVTIALGGFLWEGKSMQLFILNVVYYLVNFMVMASIISYWA